MKRFIIFLNKEFFHIFRDTRTLVILFGMPIALVVLFGFAITNEVKDAHIAILDQSKDKATRAITDRLLSSGYFMLDDNLQSVEDIEQSFKKGAIKIALVFEPEFEKKLSKDHEANVQIIADASDPNTATLLTNYATAIIKNYQKDLLEEETMPYTINSEVTMMYNPTLASVFMFVPGVMTVILMLVSTMMTSIAITKEKEMGTMEVLLVSPVNPAMIIVGKIIPYLILSMVNAAVILLLGYFVFGMPLNGSPLLLIALCVLFVICALALGILISTVSSSQQNAMMVSLFALMLPTILLSGFIFPIESMPEPLQYVSAIIPAKYFIILLKNVMLKGAGIEGVWRETLILLGFTIGFIGLSIKKFKIRL